MNYETCGQCGERWDRIHEELGCQAHRQKVTEPDPVAASTAASTGVSWVTTFRPPSETEKRVGLAGIAAAREALGPVKHKYRRPEHRWTQPKR